MHEHARIATLFAPLSRNEAGSYDLTDDAAVLSPPTGKKIVVTTDSVIEGIHVLPGATPQQFAQKLVRRNLSDLAAMGAEPWRYFLNLHTKPGLDTAWFADFTDALMHEQELFGMVLAGGDSTSGEGGIHATLTALGLCDGEPLLRSTAAAGDALYVSGTIGDAALGLQLLKQGKASPAELIERYHLPQPRLALGQALVGIASAAIDISDGLLQDAAQLATASGLGVTITRDAVPLSPQARSMLDWDSVLTGGDDYELCFTAPPSQRAVIEALSQKLGLTLTCIGTLSETPGLQLHDVHGNDVTPRTHGFMHA
jgi:thiamine-monophosphate kinase